MQQPISIDDLVRTSDNEAVRRRFDERNLSWLYFLGWAFLVSSIAATAAARGALVDTALALTSCASCGLLVLVLRRLRGAERGMPLGRLAPLAEVIRTHASAAAISFVALEYLLIVIAFRSARGWTGWAIIIALLMLGFRMVITELVLLHGYLVGTTIIAGVATGTLSMPELTAIFIVNGIALGAEQFASKGLRKQTVAFWTERRLQARDQIRMRDELQYARELQMSMLPECAPALSWLDWCGVSLPATEVGGDYYDYFVEEGRVAIVSSDVAGHGLASGLVLAAIRSGFTLLRDSLDHPAIVLTRLHDLVLQTSRRRLLATASVLLIDRRTAKATIASAGHPPILRLRDGHVEPLEIFAPPLGVRLPVRIPEITIDLQPGDTFIVHSDGIYETRNREGEYYGLDRLAAITGSQPPETDATELRNAIIRDLETFRGAAAQDDDVTIVVCRVVSV